MTLAAVDSRSPERSAKDLGAYYTDERVARFLVEWAVRSVQDCVLDPSFGGGVFLDAACHRLQALGGTSVAQVFGVELDEDAHTATATRLQRQFEVPADNLWHSDFFSLDVGTMPRIDAVVGNPPFIRYHRFAGDARGRGLACARRQGVRLSELSSSWAPFVVHCVGLVADGGRMAMVLPAELCHAAYARPVIAHLAQSFEHVTLLLFRRKLFADLSEETLLLLAEGKGRTCEAIHIRELEDAGQLDVDLGRDTQAQRSVSPQGLHRGHERVVEYLIPEAARQLYRELSMLPVVRRLSDLADVGIGYVTGANDFFHLSPDGVRLWAIPEEFLAPAVRRGRALQGLCFTQGDWQRAAGVGDAGYLLRIAAGAALPDAVADYVREGERLGVPKAYKCRVRTPWYAVPHVHRPDAFLTYMSGDAPRMVVNEVGAVAPNTLHVVRMRPGVGATGAGLAGLWWTSLTRLSVEIEGHALGGGMLKLEPTEAERVLVPSPCAANGHLAHLVVELDILARAGRREDAHDLADTRLLRDGLGLTEKECSLLRDAARVLNRRRHSRE